MHAAASREHILYSIDVLRDSIDQAMDLLSDSVLRPVITLDELEHQKLVVEYEREDLEQNPQLLVTEEMHTAAYGPAASLGRPLFCPTSNFPQIDPATLLQFIDTHYTASRMVLSAAGVDHDEFVTQAERYFSDLSIAPTFGDAPAELEPTKYIGGERRLEVNDTDLSSVAVAFEVGGWHDDDLVPVCVLHTLLGGGDAFSAGGPGKGMYSRLYREVLNSYYWIESCQAFTNIHSDAGMVGIFGSCPPAHLGHLTAILVSHVRRLAEEPVAEVELSRARNQLKSSVLMNLESRMILLEDVGRQLLTYGKRESVDDICQKIDAVTKEDILRVGARALKSAPTVVSHGNLATLPEYNLIATALR